MPAPVERSNDVGHGESRPDDEDAIVRPHAIERVRGVRVGDEPGIVGKRLIERGGGVGAGCVVAMTAMSQWIVSPVESSTA